MLSERQQKILVHMHQNGKITKNNQEFYLSPFFYVQMRGLKDMGLVKANWNEQEDGDTPVKEWELTSRGRVFAELLQELEK